MIRRYIAWRNRHTNDEELCAISLRERLLDKTLGRTRRTERNEGRQAILATQFVPHPGRPCRSSATIYDG